MAIKEPFRLLLSMLLHISLRCISAFHTVCLLRYSLFNSDPLLPAIQSFTFLGLKVITTLICCPLLCMPECICGWLKCLLCVCVCVWVCVWGGTYMHTKGIEVETMSWSLKLDRKMNWQLIFDSLSVIKSVKRHLKCEDYLLLLLIYDYKLNIFEFLDCQTEQPRRYLAIGIFNWGINWQMSPKWKLSLVAAQKCELKNVYAISVCICVGINGRKVCVHVCYSPT